MRGELSADSALVRVGRSDNAPGTACPRTPWSEPDRAWLESKGIAVTYRASLEQDLAALDEFKPDLAIGTTPVVQAAKERAIPALYFTNLISARPLMGIAGAASLAAVVNGAMASRPRFEAMRAFFEGAGQGETAGIFPHGPPKERPEFRARRERELEKLARRRKAEEMI